ncbi:5-hydroxytryptamine receptor [Fasciola hepatica]|uniref:5-hydroxytryptamine receptor n=1 Tax=Fasciola hepatica TaxID=6192 RepID=A0A4E0R9Z2_FASHE|nr:5-hydroxytryptamine receptor [Fasciola hepatica]
MHSTPKWEYIVLYLIPLGTICGNVLVCMAVYLERRLRHRFNLFLVSLAISDLLCALLVMPVSAWQMITEQVLERVEIQPVINLTVPWNVSLRSATDSAEVTKSYKGCGPNDPSFVLTAIGVTFVLPLIIMTTTYVLTVRTLQQHMEQVKAIRQYKPTNVHTTSHSQTPYLKRVHSERVPTTGGKPSILLRNLSARGIQPGSTHENTQQSHPGFQRSFLWTSDSPSERKKISDPTKGKSQFEIPDRGNLTTENQEAESSAIYQLDKNHSNEEQILVVQDTDSPGTDIKMTVYHDYQCDVHGMQKLDNNCDSPPRMAWLPQFNAQSRCISFI